MEYSFVCTSGNHAFEKTFVFETDNAIIYRVTLNSLEFELKRRFGLNIGHLYEASLFPIGSPNRNPPFDPKTLKTFCKICWNLTQENPTTGFVFIPDNQEYRSEQKKNGSKYSPQEVRLERFKRVFSSFSKGKAYEFIYQTYLDGGETNYLGLILPANHPEIDDLESIAKKIIQSKS